MKRKVTIIPIILIIASLTSCFHREPNSITYNDKTYETGWYYSGDKGSLEYYVCGFIQPEEAPLFEKSKYEFWSSSNFTFDILYAQHKDAIVWGPKVYIDKDLVDEAHAYYNNLENYNYYIGKRFNDDTEIAITDQKQKEAIGVATDVIMQKNKPNLIEVHDESPSLDIACYRRSKDGLFMTYKEELYVYDEAVYYLKEIDLSKSLAYIYDLGEAGKELYSMFIEHHLIEK